MNDNLKPFCYMHTATDTLLCTSLCLYSMLSMHRQVQQKVVLTGTNALTYINYVLVSLSCSVHADMPHHGNTELTQRQRL